MGMLRQAARATPAKLAIVQGAERITYQALLGRVMLAASALQRMGVGQGACVAAVLRNRPEFVVALLATASVRGVFLPLNPSYTKGELARLITDADAKVVIAAEPALSVCRAIAGERAIALDTLDDVSSPFPTGDGATFAGPALYLYTSGSTDTYKRVCCTQENLWWEARNFIDTIGLTADDTILCTIPLFHSYGVGNCLLDALAVGATLVMPDLPESGHDVPFVNQCGELAALIREHAVRFYPGVPYQFEVLARLPADFPIDLGFLRWCVSSGDVLPRRTYDRFLSRYGHKIRSLYGSTEAASIAIDARPAEAVAFGSLGHPLRNVTLEIRDAADAVLPPGETGDIWVRSPTIPPTGYDNRPAQTESAFRGGFFRTGDTGMLDAAGRLVMTGRKQSFVDIAGYKVDLGEIEEVLHECPGVREAAAVAVSIPILGTLIKAVVVPVAEIGAAEIRRFCRERLAFVKVPRLIELRDALPRSSTGKILRAELADVADYLAGISDAVTSRRVAQARAGSAQRRRQSLRDVVRAQAASVLSLPVEAVPLDGGFADLGMDSFAALELRVRLEYLLERELPETLTFDCPSVERVVDYLQRLLDASDRESATEQRV